MRQTFDSTKIEEEFLFNYTGKKEFSPRIDVHPVDRSTIKRENKWRHVACILDGRSMNLSFFS